MAKSIGKFIQRYAVVILFPTFTISSIYADWSHTQAWKKQQQNLAAALTETEEAAKI